MITKFSQLILGILAVAGGGGMTAARAQLALPTVRTFSGDSASAHRPVSAAEADHHVWIKRANLEDAISFRDAHYPVDSLRRVVSATAADWAKNFEAIPLTGLQHDAAARVNIVAGQEAQAEALIAKRLAMPGMRMRDRAFTLDNAVTAFADWYHPEYLPKAEMYLRQLDALGDSAAWWQINARYALQDAYYHLGRSADVARLGIVAVQRLAALPYLLQSVEEIGPIYIYTVEAVSGRPGARATIDALNAVLRSTYVAPPAVLAIDSTYVHIGESRKSWFEDLIQIAAHIGTQGAPLLSNYWVNRPTADSAVVPVNDGKIRLVEVLSYGCDGCLFALHGIQRIQDRFPDRVQGIATTFTFGYWANRLVSPEEEAQKLGDYFTNQLKVTFPIAIWKWAKVQHEDGGYRMASNAGSEGFEYEDCWRTPNGISYPLYAKPTTYVLDGKGWIRRIFIGGGREIEADMLRTVEFLLREAQQSPQPSRTSSSNTVGNTAGNPPGNTAVAPRAAHTVVAG